MIRNVLFEQAWELMTDEQRAVMKNEADAYFDSLVERHTTFLSATGAVLLVVPHLYKVKAEVVCIDQREHRVVRRVVKETRDLFGRVTAINEEVSLG